MESFSKDFRLLNKPLFDRVFQKAKKVYFPEFLILFRENEAENARLGLAVAKKSLAKAVDRNCCKRVVRESFRKTSLPKVDIIFISRRGLAQLSKSELKQKLQKAWVKLNVMQSKAAS